MSQSNMALGIILGPKSSGKSKILKNLHQFSNQHPLNRNIYLGNQLVLFNFKGLMLNESNIQESYMKLAQLIQLGFRSLKRIFVVIKYDRIENMKAIMKPIFVKIKHYIDFTTLIISSLELSSNQKQDEYLLKTDLLKYFDLKSVIFCQQDKDISEEIISSFEITLSPFDLDISKLRLIPQGIDQQQLVQMQSLFINQQNIAEPTGNQLDCKIKMTQSCYIEQDCRKRDQQVSFQQTSKFQYYSDRGIRSFGNMHSSQYEASIYNQEQTEKCNTNNIQRNEFSNMKSDEARDQVQQLQKQNQPRSINNDNQINTFNKQEEVTIKNLNNYNKKQDSPSIFKQFFGLCG